MSDRDCQDVQREVTKLLRGLARTNSRVSDGGVVGDRSQVALWKQIVEQGYVERVEVDGCFKISALGRLFLKRVLSRTPESDVADNQSESQLNSSLRPPKSKANERARTPDIDERSRRESPLGWFVRRKDSSGQPLISRAQFEAGERLREDFVKGQMGARVTTNWSAARIDGSGVARNADKELMLQDAALRARDRVRGALSAVGAELSGVLVDVCCFEHRLSEAERLASLPQRSGKVVLCLALSALARHYGLAGPVAHVAERRARMMRHWGGEGFRPHIAESCDETAA